MKKIVIIIVCCTKGVELMKKFLFIVLFLGLVPLTSNAKEDFSDCDKII